MTEWLKRGLRWIGTVAVALMVLGLAATPARGQDVRYVRTTGNDSAAGMSPATAWRTISFAATQATAGMTVYVGAGTYTEFVTTSAAGTAGSPIRFIADTSGSQTGDTGAVRIERSGTVILIDDSLWTFQGFEIDANRYGDAVRVSAATGVILDSCLIEDASSSSGSLVRVENGGAVRVTGCRLRNTRHAVRLDNGNADVLSSIVTGCSGDVFTLKSSSCELTLIASTVVGGGDDGVDAAAGTATVHNTIIADLVDDALARRGSSTITHTHNLYHDISGTTFNGTSQHSTEILVDPLFVSSSDLGLAEGSPATDAGMDVSSWVSLDYAEASRPGGGGWDIGAYESDSVLGYRPPPIAHWRLDEIIGPAAPDSSGGGRHGTVQSGAAWSARGQFGTSPAFNGVGGRVEVADDAAMRFAADESYSVSAWVYVPALGAARSRGVVAKGERDWGIWLNASDRWVAGGETDLVGPIAATGWSHVAVTQDGDAGTRALYVDGVEVATGVAAAADGAGPFWIGAAYPSGEAFAGNIDDVRVWDRAIGADEVEDGATARNFYVRTSGSNGLAGNSPATAWRTIEYALAAAPPGSTIYVGGGTYAESISSSHRATEASPTQVIADTTGAKTGDAGAVVVAPTSSEALRLNAAAHVQFRGLVFQGSGDGSDVIFMNGATVWAGFFECVISGATNDEGIDVFQNSSVLVAGCTVGPVGGHGVFVHEGILHALGTTFQNGLDGVYLNTKGSGLLNGCVIDGHTEEGLILKTDATLVNVVISNNGRRGMELHSGSDVVAYHMTVSGNGSDQIRVNGGSLTLRNSIVDSAGQKTIRRSNGTVDETSNMYWNGSNGDGLQGLSVDSGSWNEDPLLDSAQRLADISPAIDSGVDLSSVMIADAAGASRVQSGAPDLGAFEGGGGEAPIFVDVTTATGFGWDGASSDPTNWAGGWHWGDYDNDGDLDAVLTGRSQAGFFRNVGAGAGFSVATHSTGDRSRQAALGDFDNDGDLDLWHSWDELLLLNAGDGTFADAGSSGLSAPSNIEGVAPVDVDRDGLLDMVVPSQGGNYIGLNTGADPFAFNTAKNESDGFHVSGTYGNGDYVSTADVNADGITDVFYHYNGGKLFLGNGTGGFTLTPLGVTLTTGTSDKFGSAWGDYDNDGDMDLFACRYDDGQRGYLLRNDSGTFVDVTVAAGVDDGDRQFSADWGDYDNDGDLDLYVTTASGAASRLYENNGDGTFDSVDKGAAIGVDAVDAAFVDYDNDGDLDLAVSIEDENTRLLRNTTDGQASLRVRVIGMGEGGTNASGIGTRVELIADDGVTVLATREVGGARGYGGSSSLWVHFGGVDPAATYTVRTRFGSGVVDTVVVPSSVQSIIGGTTVPRLLTVTEPTRRGYDMVQWSEVDPSSEP